MKTWVVGLLLSALSSTASGQAPGPTVRVVDEALGKSAAVRYYDQYWAPLPTGPAGAHCVDQFVRVDSAGLNWRSRRYVLATRQLILEQYFTGLVPGMELEGPSREWYETGQLREEVTYHKSRVVGVLKTYYPDGKPRRMEFAAPAKGVTVCFDSTGRALPKCPPYHTFAQLSGKNTYSGKFLKLIQQGYTALLPADYAQAAELTVYYAFRIDPSGAVRDPHLLSEAPAGLEAAILRTIAALPAFTPATLEGRPTSDVVEGALLAKAIRR